MKKDGTFDKRFKGSKLKNVFLYIVVIIGLFIFLATKSEGSTIILSANILL